MAEPEVWSLDRLLASDLGRSVVWTHESLKERVCARFSQPVLGRDSTPPLGLDSLVVVGGGELIDRAKAWRVENSPSTRLFAIPSLWASGAEASPIVVLNTEQGKSFRKGPEYRPDVRVIWEDLAQAETNAAEVGLTPLLVFKRARSETYVTMRWSDFEVLVCRLDTGVGSAHQDAQRD